MAVQPSELLKNVKLIEDDYLSGLEKDIDIVLRRDWTGGKFLYYKINSKLSARVLQELENRYHGWNIEKKIDNDPRDYSSYLEFTPKA
jgi:hypothetical protein